MFNDVKEYLDNLKPQEKLDLINNLKEFQRLKSLLEAKGVIIRDQKTGYLLIIKDHAFANSFLRAFNKLTLQGVKVVDKRKDKDTLFARPEQKKL